MNLCPKEDLPAFLINSAGERRPESLSSGMIRMEEIERLKKFASTVLPAYFSEIVCASQTIMAQPVYTSEAPTYYRGRICLAGDAGSFVQPFTTSGVLKGVDNVVNLAKALSDSPTVEKALASWSREEESSATYMTMLGRQLEDALIWHIPDFATMTEPKMLIWWDEAAKLPEHLYPPLDMGDRRVPVRE